MTTTELRAEFFNTANPLLDDDEMLKKAIAALRRIRRTKAATIDIPTPEEECILEDIRQGLQETESFLAGKGEMKTMDEFLSELQQDMKQ